MTLFKIAVYLKPYKKEAIIGPIFKLMEAILELILPTIVALIINNGVGNHDSAYVYRMGGLMVLMSLLGFGCSMVCQYYAARASQGFGTTLRNKMFKHITSLSYAELDTFGTPTLINRITNDVNQLQIAVAMLIRLVIRAPFICIGAIIMSMILDFRLSLILIAATPILALYYILLSLEVHLCIENTSRSWMPLRSFLVRICRGYESFVLLRRDVRKKNVLMPHLRI